jgi:uncharacterized membrane protein (DUF485 family)
MLFLSTGLVEFPLPILCGYAPELMATKVVDSVNVAYLFALSNFVMAWVVAGIYVHKARSFDALAQQARRESGSAQ